MAGVVDFKGKNLPDKEEEENDALDFFREEGESDVIPQFKSVKEQEVKTAKEEEEDDVDPLGVIKYNLVLFYLSHINASSVCSKKSNVEALGPYYMLRWAQQLCVLHGK